MTEVLIALLIGYATISLWLVICTNSRGFVADVFFALLWPLYLYLDWKNGRLR